MSPAVAEGALALLVFLAEASVRATPLLAVALAWSVLRPRGAPELRHLVLAAALTGALLMPVLAIVLPSWALTLPALGSGWSAGAEMGSGQAGGFLVGSAAAHEPSVAAGTGGAALWLVGLWLAGSAILLGRLALGLAGLVRLHRAARAARMVRTERSDRGRRDVFGEVEVMTTAAVDGPVALALPRPTVLLPVAAESWEPDQRRAVLAHELAHLRRRDPWTLVLAALATALHWPNPLVWLAARHLRLAGEEACDRAALRSGVEPWRYADLLVRLARGAADSARHPLAPAAAGPGLSRRVEAVLGPSRSVGRLVLTVAALAAVAVSVLAAAARPTGDGSARLDSVETPAPSSVSASRPAGNARPGAGAKHVSALDPSLLAPGTRRNESPRPRAAADSGSALRRHGSPPAAAASRDFAARYGIDEALARDILAAAEEERVEAPLAFGLVRVESGFDPDRTSRAGAVGLTQIMPSSAASLDPDVSAATLFEPRTNLRLGLRLLRGYFDRFGGDERRALLAYNVGPRRVAAPGPPPASDYPDRVLAAAALAPPPAL